MHFQDKVVLMVGASGDLGVAIASADVAARSGPRAFLEATNRGLALECRCVYVAFFSPSPADTEAKRPFLPLWRAMGTPNVPPERVAAELVNAVVRRRPFTVTGGPLTRAFAALNAVAPGLADALLMCRYGALMRRQFGGEESDGPSPGGAGRGAGRALGILLVAASTLAYLLLFAVPLLAATAATKAGIAGGLAVVGEISCWAGDALLGRKLIARFRQYLNPRSWCCRPGGVR